ncbi:ABC transporter substrate-binding protein [Thalassospira marina]|nr:iron-siderophore ABC transporter substrate-binding protein [Thalassospira marina]
MTQRLSGHAGLWTLLCNVLIGPRPRKDRKYARTPLLLLATGMAFLCTLPSRPAFADTAPAGQIRTITHDMGTTDIKGTPKRIITLFQGATDTAIALGVKPVGVVESWVSKPAYPYLRNALEGTEYVGLETQPNLEKLVALKPDLIIASKFRHETLYPQLSAIAPVVFLDEIFDFKHTLTLMGAALNRTEKANQLLNQWNARVAHFKKEMSQRDNIKWPMTVSLLNFRADHLRLLSHRSFSGLIMNELGFEQSSMADTNNWIYKKLTSKEALPIINADTFFVFLRAENPAVRENYDAWRSHPLWKALKASRNQQIYEVDEITWSLSGGIMGANMILDDLYRIYDVSALDG